MDTSEQYIKMCDCPEIQEQKPSKDTRLDYADKNFYHDTFWTEKIEEHLFNGEPIYNLCSKAIWLPRQDDLQKMYRKNTETDLAILSDFCYAILLHPKPHNGYYRQFTSMEQLWLAFYMKEVKNKVWDDGWK